MNVDSLHRDYFGLKGWDECIHPRSTTSTVFHLLSAFTECVWSSEHLQPCLCKLADVRSEGESPSLRLTCGITNHKLARKSHNSWSCSITPNFLVEWTAHSPNENDLYLSRTMAPAHLFKETHQIGLRKSLTVDCFHPPQAALVAGGTKSFILQVATCCLTPFFSTNKQESQTSLQSLWIRYCRCAFQCNEEVLLTSLLSPHKETISSSPFPGKIS